MIVAHAEAPGESYLDPGFGLGPLPDLEPADIAGAIITYQGALMRSLIEEARVTMKVSGLPGRAILNERDGAWVLTAGDFGFGAPAVVVLIEKLVALGIRRFVTVGTAGGLQPGSRSGDLVLCDGAVRDDGVSHHYLDAHLLCQPSATLTDAVETALPVRPVRGLSWTMDAPFRETHGDVRRHRLAGVLTVEMEAASIFAVASYRRVDLAAVLVVSDLLGADAWQPCTDAGAVTRSLRVGHAAATTAVVELAAKELT